jgi:hypothetical protein
LRFQPTAPDPNPPARVSRPPGSHPLLANNQRPAGCHAEGRLTGPKHCRPLRGLDHPNPEAVMQGAGDSRQIASRGSGAGNVAITVRPDDLSDRAGTPMHFRPTGVTCDARAGPLLPAPAHLARTGVPRACLTARSPGRPTCSPALRPVDVRQHRDTHQLRATAPAGAEARHRHIFIPPPSWVMRWTGSAAASLLTRSEQPALAAQPEVHTGNLLARHRRAHARTYLGPRLRPRRHPSTARTPLRFQSPWRLPQRSRR